MPKQIIQTPTRWVTKEVAEHFRTTDRTILNWRNNAGLPCIRIIARKIVYDPHELEAWARQRALAR